MIPRPVAVFGPFQGVAFPVAAGEQSLGRDRSNAIGPDGLAVSRRRALITLDGEQLHVTNLSSGNRMAISRVLVTARALEDGDPIWIAAPPSCLVTLKPRGGRIAAVSLFFDQ